MKYITITGLGHLRMPMIGLATWRAPPEEVQNTVLTVLDIGYRHIDTAFNYNNEEVIGLAIKDWLESGKGKREDLFITTKSRICVTSDIDTLLFHMNNARYMRELDFARVDFYERTGLYRCIKNKGGGLVMGATTIRYRRFVKLFHMYVLTSKIIYWDDQNIYMEHRFISPRDRFVNAIVLSKTRLIKCNADEIMQEMILSKNDPDRGKNRPEIPPDLEKWMESNAISSQALRGAVFTS